MPSKRERKLISKNRSAHHEYFIDETFECGIELSGTEVKSIRERACQITDTFALHHLASAAGLVRQDERHHVTPVRRRWPSPRC